MKTLTNTLTKTQKRKRNMTMIFGAFAIFFTGYPHVWSIYQPYMMALTGWSQGQASMCFYLSFCTFVFGNIIGGRLQDQYNPRLTIAVGGAIFAAGVLLSAFCISASPIPVYITYGLMQGLGQGMVYTTIISTAQKWFPGRTGFASGVVVTANGLCGFFLAPASRMLLDAGGPKLAFLVIGTAIAVSWILCTLFFRSPDQEFSEASEPLHGMEPAAEAEEYPAAKKDLATAEAYPAASNDYTSMEMVHTRSFYALLATMMFGLISYFMISPVSQTHQIQLGIPSAVAVGAVMLGSVVNAATRLVIPALADQVGRIVCIKGILLVSVLAMILLSISDSYAVTVAIVLMYGCYGGIMGNFPSFTSAIFGMKHSGENYGFVMLGIVAATFGAPAIMGAMTGNGLGLKSVFAVGAVFALCSVLCLRHLKRELINHDCQLSGR